VRAGSGWPGKEACGGVEGMGGWRVDRGPRDN
jgi:hypothetical protein